MNSSPFRGTYPDRCKRYSSIGYAPSRHSSLRRQGHGFVTGSSVTSETSVHRGGPGGFSENGSKPRRQSTPFCEDNVMVTMKRTNRILSLCRPDSLGKVA